VSRSRIAATLALAGALLTAPAADAANTKHELCLRAPTVVCGVMWGVYTSQVSLTEGWAKPFTDLETQVGRKFSLIKRYHDWSNQGGSGQFPDKYERELGADGSRTLYFAWTSKAWATGTAASWASIAAGDYDQSVILPAAQRIKAWGHTVFIDFDHEMDGRTRTTSGTPAEYVAAHRHIHDVFEAAGVTNVVWAWVPTGTMANRDLIRAMYPGDAYVDWVGYDPYNFYTCNGSRWQTPTESLQPFYDWLSANITSDKPILLGEYGTVSDANDPARARQWYADLPAALESMPRIRALMQWSSSTSTTCDFRLTQDPQALDGFRTAGRKPYVSGVL
jgi:hypothetical protein